jgi:hypothetical protein
LDVPVDFEPQDAGTPRIDLLAESDARRLLAVLLEIPAAGYTPVELADQTGVPRENIRPTLNRLAAAGLACYTEPYWEAPEDDRIAVGTAAFIGVEPAASTETDDWYAQDQTVSKVHDLASEAT